VNSDLEQLRDQLLDASLIIDSQELNKAYGNLSARIPDREAMVITPRRAPGLLTDPDELILVDFDGRLLEGAGPVPIEVALHSEIYRTRSAVGAVVRSHGKYANVLGILGKRPRAVHGFGAFLGAEVPIFNGPLPISSVAVARDLVATLGDADAVLLRGNGNVVLGASVPEATVKAIFLEESCELQYLAFAAGQPIPLTQEELAGRREVSYEEFARAWEYYRERCLFDVEVAEETP
jgi:ribulose-5-phosphate 4-epimerase/fuculose-1-phosphate aldolase